MRRLWGSRIDQWVYFALPSTVRSSVRWAQDFCAITHDTCIVPDDAELLHRLDHTRMWYDAGHLSKRGAQIYTKWLAHQLAASGALKK